MAHNQVVGNVPQESISRTLIRTEERGRDSSIRIKSRLESRAPLSEEVNISEGCGVHRLVEDSVDAQLVNVGVDSVWDEAMVDAVNYRLDVRQPVVFG